MDDYLKYFYEFLIWGSYPRIVLENTYEKKEKLLTAIVSSYIYKVEVLSIKALKPILSETILKEAVEV